MNNKKGFLNIATNIMLIFIILAFGIFTLILVDQATEEFLFEPIFGVSQEFSKSVGLSTEFNDTLNTLNTEYKDRDIPYDLFFILFFLMQFGFLSFISSTYTCNVVSIIYQ